MEQVTLVTICREPLAVTLRFLAWHRRLGATHVLLHLDDPADPVLPYVAGLDWVTPILCTPEFWQGQGVAPDAPFPRRQLAALTHGYRMVQGGWVAVADADELFWFGGRRFAEVLTSQPSDLRGLRVGTAEYVETGPTQNERGLHFRLPMTKAQAGLVYGASASLLRPTEGLIGHRAGKSITRAGLNIRRMRPHWAVAPRERDMTDARIGPDATAALLHLVNPDYAGWRAKLAWRMAAQGGISVRIKRRVAEIQAGSGDTEAGLQQLFAQIYGMDAEGLARLQKAGVHLTVKEDMLAITREVFADAPGPVPGKLHSVIGDGTLR